MRILDEVTAVAKLHALEEVELVRQATAAHQPHSIPYFTADTRLLTFVCIATICCPRRFEAPLNLICIYVDEPGFAL